MSKKISVKTTDIFPTFKKCTISLEEKNFSKLLKILQKKMMKLIRKTAMFTRLIWVGLNYISHKKKNKYYFTLYQPIDKTRSSCDYFNDTTSLYMDGYYEIKNVKIEKGLLTFDADTNTRDLEEVKIDQDLYPDIWGQVAKIKKSMRKY